MLVLIKILFTSFLLFSTYNSQGTSLYKHFSERCCEGSVYALPNGDNYYDYTCCGSDMYKIKAENGSAEITSRCCGKKLYQSVNSTTLCCGTELIDNRTQACHRWGEWRYGEEEFEAIDLSPDHQGKTGVCGKSKEDRRMYNPQVEICCSGVYHKKEENMACCGELYINTTVSKCCYEMFIDDFTDQFEVSSLVIHHNGVQPNRSKCCNGSLIDAEKQKCCGGVVVDLPKNYSKIFDDEEGDDDDFDIIWDFLFSDCCGTQLLSDAETQVCVDYDHIVSRENRNQIFCDGQLHNISGEDPLNVYCVNGTIWTLPRHEHLCSINSTTVTYDTTKQVCGFNELIDRIDDDVQNNRKSACYKSTYMYSTRVYPDLIYTGGQQSELEMTIDNTL